MQAAVSKTAVFSVLSITGKISRTPVFPVEEPCQSLRIRLWHLNNPFLPNAPSQSLRIRLWHLKNPDLTKSREPKPPNSACAEFANQNAEFHWRLWHLNNFALPKAVSQSLRKKCRFHWRKNIPRRKPANRPQNSALPNSGVLAQGVCTRQGVFDAKTPLP